MNARLHIPHQAKRGELLEIRLVIQHPMETGFRRDEVGRVIAKNVIRQLTCRYRGREIFRAEIDSGLAANPYLRFYARADVSGEFEFDWIDDQDHRGRQQASITVIE